ncbi:MAG: DUF4255 domain-containing protein [Prolixibacteraceae bacterium]|nr:DUF4255 domain-containing protein [Prolixibacteraceae bacterium]
MIHPVLKFLAEQLNTYIEEVKKPGDILEAPYVILQNISRLDEDAIKNTNKVLISLVNISEESTMKNNPDYALTRNNLVNYNNPPINLNLFIMITSFMTNYENALIYLSHAITFFQGKYSFTLKDSTTEVEGLPDDFHIILDLYNLGFEQLNYVWSTFGGKQHPFVCFKVRLIKMERESTREIHGVIKEVQIDGRNKK